MYLYLFQIQWKSIDFISLVTIPSFFEKLHSKLRFLREKLNLIVDFKTQNKMTSKIQCRKREIIFTNFFREIDFTKKC